MTARAPGAAARPAPHAATVEITPNSSNINTSTYGSNSFEVTNDSADGQEIAKVTLDLRTALLPDLVFDPDGTAGDTTAKAFQANSGEAGDRVHRLVAAGRPRRRGRLGRTGSTSSR